MTLHSIPTPRAAVSWPAARWPAPSAPRPAAALVSLIVLAASACAPADTGPDGPTLAALFDDRVTVVDLTHAVSAQAPYWPGPDRSPFTHDTLRAHPDGAPAMAAYAVPEHFGTHLDAPVHSAAGGRSVDRLDPARLFGPAVVVDVTGAVAADADYAVTADDLRDWETAHGIIPDGAIVLARTGWASRWEDGDAYYARDAEGTLHFPGFAEGAARFLVDERDVAGIGIDSGSVDPGNARGFPVHGLVNGSGAFHLENVADMSGLPEAGAYLVVAPVKIEGGSGGQVRVFAVIP
jgi:kynurenine formamidase